MRRFVIVNMIKKTSFFSQGMMISIFSVKKDRYFYNNKILQSIMV